MPTTEQNNLGKRTADWLVESWKMPGRVGQSVGEIVEVTHRISKRTYDLGRSAILGIANKIEKPLVESNHSERVIATRSFDPTPSSGREIEQSATAADFGIPAGQNRGESSL